MLSLNLGQNKLRAACRGTLQILQNERRKMLRHYDEWLMKAVTHGYHEAIDIFIDKGADVNSRSACGDVIVGKSDELIVSKDHTPLMHATYCGHGRCVEELIQAGADVNLVGQLRLFCIVSCSSKRHVMCSKLLVESGADVNFAVRNEKADAYARVFVDGDGSKENVERGWKMRRAHKKGDPTARGGCTQLLISAENGHTDCLNYLLKVGGNVNTLDHNHETALMKAAKEGHPKCVESLIRCGVEVNATDLENNGRKASFVEWKYGATALLRAAEKGHAECIRLLI